MERIVALVAVLSFAGIVTGDTASFANARHFAALSSRQSSLAGRLVGSTREPSSVDDGGIVSAPVAWGCAGDAVASAAAPHGGPTAARATIPPPRLVEDVSNLKVGRAFPTTAEYDLPIVPEQIASIEQEFCKRDGELVCPSATERERIVGDMLQRTARISSLSRSGSAEWHAAKRVGDNVRQGRLPIVQFSTSIRNGPTAAILRYQDPHTGKWILGIAFAKDFVSSSENSLFLDGVLVQEMVHYDDLSFLPDPLRCYESNIEIRGHYAMIEYWKHQHRDGAPLHPRIALVMRPGLDTGSSRATWYRYLNQVEKTDFLVEDELVSLEFRSLPALSADRVDDQRFLGELTSIVSSALRKGIYVQTHVARLSSDSINGNARVISAVSRLMPRVLRHYERVRGELREPDGTTRTATMGTELADIHRSLNVLTTLMGALAADPDFRRKSEFVGPE